MKKSNVQTGKKAYIRDKWMVIVASFIMVMISLGFTSSTKTLFPDEIAKALSVERSLVSIGESCRYVATAIVNIFFGFLISKFGVKKLVFAGFISLIASMLLYSYAESILWIYVAGSLLGIGLSWTTTTMVGYIIGIWCAENKGKIMGTVLAANGIGGAVAIQLVGGKIDPNVVGSYRNAYRLIVIVLVVTVIAVMVLMRERPKNMELLSPISSKKKKRGQDWVGVKFSDAARKGYFWCTILCVFLSGMILQGTHGIAAMHFKDVGIDYSMVKGLMSGGSLMLAGAKFLVGFFYDKTGLRVTSGICIVIAALATFILAFTSGDDVGFVLALIYTAISPFSLPLETIMLPIYASDLFGNMSYSKILGFLVSANTMGYAIGAPIMNLSYDIMGSYVPALFAVGSVMIGVLILMQFVISAAHKERKRIELEQAGAVGAETSIYES